MEKYREVYERFGVESVPPDADFEQWVTQHPKEIYRGILSCYGCECNSENCMEQKSDIGVGVL